MEWGQKEGAISKQLRVDSQAIKHHKPTGRGEVAQRGIERWQRQKD